MGGEMRMLKDPGAQSVAWAGFSTVWAVFSPVEWLSVISVLLGLIATLINIRARCRETKLKLREDARSEERHQQEMRFEKERHELEMKKLKQELINGQTN